MDFDPSQITYGDLLSVFWAGHHPEQRPWDRQYASIIFYHSEEQRKQAEASKAREEARRNARICTEIVPAATFTTAEDYHQKYYLRGDAELMSEFDAIYPTASDFIASTAASRVNGLLAGYGRGERLREDVPRLGLSEAGQRRLLDLAKLLPSPQCQ